MRKRDLRMFAAALALLLCTACGQKNPDSNKIKDYSGVYTDKQGTDVTYSSLELQPKGDGSYTVTLGIYRTTEMIGTAEAIDTGRLHFACSVPDFGVSGDILIEGGTATVTVTESNFEYVPVGTEYIFSDGE